MCEYCDALVSPAGESLRAEVYAHAAAALDAAIDGDKGEVVSEVAWLIHRGESVVIAAAVTWVQLMEAVLRSRPGMARRELTLAPPVPFAGEDRAREVAYAVVNAIMHDRVTLAVKTMQAFMVDVGAAGDLLYDAVLETLVLCALVTRAGGGRIGQKRKTGTK